MEGKALREHMERKFQHRTQPETMRYLKFSQDFLELEPHEMRILDFGSGVGGAVYELRLLGYDVVGADIEGAIVDAGQQLLEEQGMDGRALLFEIGPDGELPFPDNYFHFVYSQEVFEHVEEVDKATAELARVTAPDGLGFHIYRPPYELIEPHFFMPFVHWLPKGPLRKIAIAFWSHLGIGLRPPEIPGASAKQRAEFLYNYSKQHTYYPTTWSIAKKFRAHGLDTCFIATNHRKLHSQRQLLQMMNIRPLRKVVEFLVLLFHTGSLFTRATVADGGSTLYFGDWKGSWQRATGPKPGLDGD